MEIGKKVGSYLLTRELCGRESLCDIRRDCYHRFVSKRDFGCDAKQFAEFAKQEYL